MKRSNHQPSITTTRLLFTVLLNAIILERGFTTEPAIYGGLFVSVPLLAVALLALLQTRQSAARRLPSIGGLRKPMNQRANTKSSRSVLKD